MWITREYMKKRGCGLGAWCSLFKGLKSGFSRGDFGPLLIHELPALLRPDHCAPNILIIPRKPLLDGSPDHCSLRYPIALQESLILRESLAHLHVIVSHMPTCT